MLVGFWHTSVMADVVRLGCCCESVAVRKRLLECVVLLALVGSMAVVRAQDAPKPQDEPITTLHVYTNLLQVPVVVLGSNRERIPKPIAENRFSVSIDSGPWFRATHVRQEGQDPISLGILLDVSGDEEDIMPKIADAIGGLAPLALHPQDHVSIYAVECSLIHFREDVPVGTGDLKLTVDKVLEPWVLRKHEKHQQNCGQVPQLWDTLTFVTQEVRKAPGWPVILAVSDGIDKRSVRKWNELRTYAQELGVAIFGMTYIPISATSGEAAVRRLSNENSFLSVCELSGGMVLFAKAGSVDDTLRQFTTTVRERYIVEFPRPAHSTGGQHELSVKVARGDDFIRAAGITVPLPDAALLADPSTVPSDPTRTPQMGTRKIMTKPQ